MVMMLMHIGLCEPTSQQANKPSQLTSYLVMHPGIAAPVSGDMHTNAIQQFDRDHEHWNRIRPSPRHTSIPNAQLTHDESGA